MQARPTGRQHIQLQIVTDVQGCPRLDAQGVTGRMKDAGIGLRCPEGGRADAGAEIPAQRGAMDIGIAIGDGGKDEDSPLNVAKAEMGRQIGQVGTEMIRRNLNIQPTLEIRPGYRFNVMVNKDIILSPYKNY